MGKVKTTRRSGPGLGKLLGTPKKSTSMSRPKSGWYNPFTDPPKKGFVPKKGSKSASKYK